MQIENLFIKRTKELPSDATTSGHKLALKGGYIHQTGAGIYTYSHLGFKVLQNIEKIIKLGKHNTSLNRLYLLTKTTYPSLSEEIKKLIKKYGFLL